MELRRTAEALLRGQHGILPFLAPALTRPRAITPSAFHFTQRKCLSTSPFLKADDKPATQSQSEVSNKAASPSSDILSILDATLDSSKGVPTARTTRTSRFKSAAAQDANRRSGLTGLSNASSPSNSTDGTGNGGSSMSDLLANFTNTREVSASGRRMNTGFMLDPLGNTGPLSKQEQQARVPEPFPVALGPSLGRTVSIDAKRGIDFARALRTLDVLSSRNKIRTDSRTQRYHERPGLKRKRLASEKWRKRFKEGFRGMVKRVMKMKKQGW